VGEALGEEEEDAGVPFVGRAGRQLRRMVTDLVDPSNGLNFRLEDFRLYNTIWCRPPNNVLTGASYESDALRLCAPTLDAVVGKERPSVLVALGNQALRRLVGEWGIDSLRGYYFHPPGSPLVIGTYHPSYIMRGKFELSRVFQLDLLKAIEAARGHVYSRDRTYDLHPSAKEVAGHLAWLGQHPEVPVAFDIETPYGAMEKEEEFLAIEDTATYTILRISFSWKEGWAFSIPWMAPFDTLAAQILALPNPKVTWNGTGFDVPRLEGNGVPVAGPHYDAMLAWHALEPSLPMGLKYVATMFCPDMSPWKLKAFSDPEWYNSVDSDMTICCFNAIKKRLEQQQRWDMFLKHFVEVDAVLRAMSNRGICVDVNTRRETKKEFQKRLDDTTDNTQGYVPNDMRKKKVYKSSEAALRKAGRWVEKRMITVLEEAELKEGWELREGWLVRKKKEKKVAKRKTKTKVPPRAGGTGHRKKSKPPAPDPGLDGGGGPAPERA
jgi:uracil-DNA glycosylase family 4